MLQLVKVIFLIASLVAAGISGADTRTVKRLVVFGDSLSDQGNLYNKYLKLIPQSPPYWDGRFSNGPVWTDILSEDYDIVNESEGGATVVDYTLYSNDFWYPFLTNLSKEICSFLGKHDFLPTDLVVILLGANDYIGDDPVHDDNVHRVIRDLADNIAYIQRKGAQQVLVVNLPDLGRTPYELLEGNGDVKSVVIETHNRLLDERLSSLFSPHFLQIFDLHAHVDALLQAPAAHGMTNTLSPCKSESTTSMSGYDHYTLQPSELDNYTALTKSPDLGVVVSTPLNETPLCEGFFYFDDLHPTTDAHALIAKQVDIFIRKHYSPVFTSSPKLSCDLDPGKVAESPVDG